ncbi:MAG: phosphatidylglycerol lysyltransferase domain-containing protein, partial [Cetobacterium sp.]
MDWKKLTIDSREELQKFLKNKFETSDMNFTNLFLWSFSENIQYTVENEILYIKGFYEGNEYYFSPVSKDDNKDKMIDAVKKIKEKNGKILFIPEIYKEFLKEDFIVTEERDSFDYIYLQEDLAELKGRKFSSKKNKINK